MAPAHLALLVLVLPLLSAAAIALFLRRQGVLASYVSVAAAAGILGCSSLLIFGGYRDFPASVEWLQLGRLTISLGVKFDDLAALMLFVVSFIGFLIHVFSLGYMSDDPARARYFAGLSVFMASMCGIVLADNLFMIFIFWELVGFSSYLLIGHWFERPSASAAAKKAFIVNRVGDFGFLLGILACYWLNDTVNLTELAAKGSAGTLVVSRAIPLLLFCGAVGKSAQLPLHVWLPDAMEGPTPVSALIHAATMVAAGIYMLCRIQVLMVPQALTVIMWVGTGTALYAALCAIAQRDIKKVLAYSTLSQLGFMVAAFGLGALKDHGGAIIAAGVGAAMFHLTTHAFFKALLFLGSGSVIHGCHHEQDIFKMGGLWRRMPVTFWTFTVGVAAIVGVPFLSGFYSKDAILYLALQKNHAVFGVLVFTAILTAFYMVRMWKIVFLGEARSDAAGHAHESGAVMTVPLLLLALGSICAGYGWAQPQAFRGVLTLIPQAHGEAHTIIFLVSLGILAVGAGAAWFLYRPAAEDSLQRKAPGLFALLASKLWIDEAYLYYVRKVQQRFALVLDFCDRVLLAGVIIRGTAGVVGMLSMGVRTLHSGSLHAYVYWFLLGVAFFWACAAGIF
ncbi:MAG: NADH-quinone oxidoreductase subunit L [Opitutae bacterium]|nr:NADH-quinone oxidoreductase subunit L [Opitutae bacterium]